MPDVAYLHKKPFTVVLVYDDGSELGDWRLLPGVADRCESQLYLRPALEMDGLRIPERAYEEIEPVTPDVRDIFGEAEYYLIMHVAPMPEESEKIRAEFIAFE